MFEAVLFLLTNKERGLFCFCDDSILWLLWKRFHFFSSCGNCSKKIRVYNIDKKIKLNCKLCIQPLPLFENFGFFDLQNAKKSCKKWAFCYLKGWFFIYYYVIMIWLIFMPICRSAVKKPFKLAGFVIYLDSSIDSPVDIFNPLQHHRNRHITILATESKKHFALFSKTNWNFHSFFFGLEFGLRHYTRLSEA